MTRPSETGTLAEEDPAHPASLGGRATADWLSGHLPLAQAADGLPRRRKGRKTHVATLYRWTTTGCRGVKLRYTMVGATRCTTREWLEEFFARLTEARSCPAPGEARPASSPPPSMPATRSAAQRKRAVEAALRELAAAGI